METLSWNCKSSEDFSISLKRRSTYVRDQCYDPRNQSFLLSVVDVALHSVGFARTRLPIRHYRPIESVQNVAQRRISHELENFLLGSSAFEHFVKHKRYLISVALVFENQLFGSANAMNFLLRVFELLFIEWAETTEHSDVARVRQRFHKYVYKSI
jgi:hypothetical protein